VVVEWVPPVSDLDVVEVEVKVDDADDLIMIGIREHSPVVVDPSSTFDVRRSGLFLEDLVVDSVAFDAFDAFDSFDVGYLYPGVVLVVGGGDRRASRNKILAGDDLPRFLEKDTKSSVHLCAIFLVDK
jgi:hypothetical protein